MAVISISEYARQKGWSHVNVIKKIKSGTIPACALVQVPGRKKPKIDSEIADKEILKRGDMEKTMSAITQKKDVSKEALLDQSQKDLEDWEKIPDTNSNQPEQPDHFLKYKTAKATREELQVHKLQMEIKEKEGKLLDADEVRARIIKLVSETKAALLNIPGKVGPELLACHDLMELEHKLTEEINNALRSLSRSDFGGTP